MILCIAIRMVCRRPQQEDFTYIHTQSHRSNDMQCTLCVSVKPFTAGINSSSSSSNQVVGATEYIISAFTSIYEYGYSQTQSKCIDVADRGNCAQPPQRYMVLAIVMQSYRLETFATPFEKCLENFIVYRTLANHKYTQNIVRGCRRMPLIHSHCIHITRACCTQSHEKKIF